MKVTFFYMFTYIFHILKFSGIISFPEITRKWSGFPGIQKISFKVETLSRTSMHHCQLFGRCQYWAVKTVLQAVSITMQHQNHKATSGPWLDHFNFFYTHIEHNSLAPENSGIHSWGISLLRQCQRTLSAAGLGYSLTNFLFLFFIFYISVLILNSTYTSKSVNL